jgi:general secretion pathway protein K
MRAPGRAGGESGIALLVVLLAITLLTIVVVEFTDFAQVETHMALSARNALQATYLARSAVNVAEALVSYDPTPGSDGAEDFWARPYPPLPIGDGSAIFRVRDEARFLNLNDMFSGDSLRPERVEVFKRLFKLRQVDESILWAIVDWIDKDPYPHVDPIGAEQTFYVGLRPPIFVRNAPLLTLRELLLVRGVTPSVLARLEDFVTVLPPSGSLKVNVNTTRAEVLYALSEGMLGDPGVVDRLLASRDTAQFTAPSEAFKNVTGLDQDLAGSKEFIDTNSSYFRLEGVGDVDGVRRGVVEVVKREGKKVTRFSWTPSTSNLSLTSQPPSDFLATLPVFGDR